MKKRKRRTTWTDNYRPSPPCNCDICRAFCRRPGWWTVAEAAQAFEYGLGNRMMLEVSPEFSFGVLSPAFRGCEKNVALQNYAQFGCCFLKDGLCELHGSPYQPLECRVCHHDRKGAGARCHADIEKDWNTAKGQALVERWVEAFGVLQKYGIHK